MAGGLLMGGGMMDPNKKMMGGGMMGYMAGGSPKIEKGIDRILKSDMTEL